MENNFLRDRLNKRARAGNLRALPRYAGLADFVSNDYLGLSGNRQLGERIEERIKDEGFMGNGGTGSRLLSGNHRYVEQLEHYLAGVFQSESALVFNSGYAANQAVVASLPEKGDTVIYDQLSHVCLKEGAWLSAADTIAFRHNDTDDLEMKLIQATGRKFVLTETVFSMDGDVAPLAEVIGICKRHQAYLIVDEAHSTGVFGENGSGMLVGEHLADQVFARIYTFGKGMGVHGACVAGSKDLIDYLVNFGRPFIYTTSLPPHSVISIEESFRFLAENAHLQEDLKKKISLFQSGYPGSISGTAIQPVMIGSNEKARTVAARLQEQGYDVRPILSPTVKRGTERLRISLHVHNTDEEIVGLTGHLKRLLYGDNEGE